MQARKNPMKLITLTLNTFRTIISIILGILGLLSTIIGAGILLLFELAETFLQKLMHKIFQK